MDLDSKPATHKEQEINQSLSKELHVKCKISDIPTSVSNSMPTNKNLSVNTYKEVTNICNITKTEEKNTYNKNCSSAKQNKPGTFSNFNEHAFPDPIEAQFSSMSEAETQSFLPKSSGTCSFGNQKESSLKSDDDSSSVSSSVLGSSAASSPLKGCKRGSTSSQTANPSKAPKFVLREPRLSFEQNQIVVDANKISSPKRSAKPKNSNLSSSLLLKTESSQRKAWNARNSTNFNVCKEFYFKVSSFYCF